MSITPLAAATLAVLLSQRPAPSPQDAQAPAPSTSSATPAQLAAFDAELAAARRAMLQGRALEAAGVGSLIAGLFVTESMMDGGGEGRLFAGQALVAGSAILMTTGGIKGRDGKTTTKWLTTHGPMPMSRAAWAVEHDASEQKRTRGRLVQFAIGVPIMAAGLGMSISARGCSAEGYDCAQSRGLGGLMAAMAGAFVSDAGWRTAHDASVTLKLLEKHQPGTIAPGSPVTFTVHPRIGASPRKDTAMFFRVTW